MNNIHLFVTNNEESSWQKASASLDASAKIYAFRVDSVYTDTFRFLGGLSRNDIRKSDVELILDDSEESENFDFDFINPKKLSKYMFVRLNFYFYN